MSPEVTTTKPIKAKQNKHGAPMSKQGLLLKDRLIRASRWNPSGNQRGVSYWIVTPLPLRQGFCQDPCKQRTKQLISNRGTGQSIRHHIFYASDMSDVKTVRLQKQRPPNKPLIWTLEGVQKGQRIMICIDNNWSA